ncbi:MAG: alpha/beta hydrolase [Spirochaetes bacterium]|nr:alpha/beta hydrolase [Spirochaetota bacterium]
MEKNNPVRHLAGAVNLKYPVVLVHGIVAHDRGRANNFWGRIPGKLHEKGERVFLGNTDSWGGYESNAKLLKTTVDKVLRETKSEKVNLIGHSKGGIDSRFYIWKYGGEKVASLTTISTPHRGSEIADLIYRQKIVYNKAAEKSLYIFGKLYGDTNPDIQGVNFQLTTKKMQEFNENVPMAGNVYCQSLYTTIKNPFDDLTFFYSYLYVKSVSGENDGVVSEWSANWGENAMKIGEGISHAEIIDYKKKMFRKADVPDIYVKITNNLAKKGF